MKRRGSVRYNEQKTDKEEFSMRIVPLKAQLLIKAPLQAPAGQTKSTDTSASANEEYLFIRSYLQKRKAEKQ